MTMAKPERCENCRFWDKDSVRGSIAFCNRYPPQMVVFDAAIGVRGNQQACEVVPETHRDDWCGEWEAKPDGEA